MYVTHSRAHAHIHAHAHELIHIAQHKYHRMYSENVLFVQRFFSPFFVVVYLPCANDEHGTRSQLFDYYGTWVFICFGRSLFLFRFHRILYAIHYGVCVCVFAWWSIVLTKSAIFVFFVFAHPRPFAPISPSRPYGDASRACVDTRRTQIRLSTIKRAEMSNFAKDKNFRLARRRR